MIDPRPNGRAIRHTEDRRGVSSSPDHAHLRQQAQMVRQGRGSAAQTRLHLTSGQIVGPGPHQKAVEIYCRAGLPKA